MSLSKVSIQGLGGLISVIAIAASAFLVVQPLNSQIKANETQLQTAKVTSTTKEMKLAKLEKGVDTFEEAKADTQDFLTKVTKDKNIESASRAMSTAITSGVSIVSFNFGEGESITALPVPEASLDGFTSPVTLKAPSKSAGKDGGATASALEPFHRVPLEVSVTAKSYDALSKYLDNLATQTRLISVVNIDSTKPAGDSPVTAKIHAYAFVYAK